MILREIQTYLQDRPMASLELLENHFRLDGEALRGMLDLLIRKGRVVKLPIKQCSGCHSCVPSSLEFYQWVDLKHQSIPLMMDGASLSCH